MANFKLKICEKCNASFVPEKKEQNYCNNCLNQSALMKCDNSKCGYEMFMLKGIERRCHKCKKGLLKIIVEEEEE